MIKDLKEVNISVIGNQNKARFSPIEEVSNGFLDFDKKYNPNGGAKGSKTKGVKNASASKGMASTVRIVPADLKPEQQKIIEETALKVFRVLNSFGLVRIDFMIDRKSGEVYCNEINTIPGSLAFYLWKHAGIEFDAECDEMIENALNRYALKGKKTYSFDTTILENYRKK